MAFEEYLVGEVALDHADGHLTRREAIAKLVALGLSATGAAIVLGGASAAAASKTTAKRKATTTVRRATTTRKATTSTPTTRSSSSTSTAVPTTTAARAVGGSTPIRFPGPAGALLGTYAAPERPLGAVLVIHENRGLTDHFKAFPARLAADGYAALAIDLASRVGGTDAVAAQMPGPLAAISTADLVADLRAGLDELARRVPGARLAVMGFCFGGGMTWSLLAAGEPRLAAAVPFYGPGPDRPDFAGSKNAAVLGVYAELDSRVNASREAMRTALSTAGLTHEIRTFPGVDHAFFNDTGARYDATQAAAAYAAVLAWFGAHLARP